MTLRLCKRLRANLATRNRRITNLETASVTIPPGMDTGQRKERASYYRKLLSAQESRAKMMSASMAMTQPVVKNAKAGDCVNCNQPASRCSCVCPVFFLSD